MDRFSDYVVKDVETGDYYRAVELIKQVAEKMYSLENTPVHVKNALKSDCSKVCILKCELSMSLLSSCQTTQKRSWAH